MTLMKPARTGGGIGESAPRTDFHRISFSSYSGVMSASVKFMASDASAPQALAAFFSSSGTRAGSAVYGVATGVVWNALYIGVAAASYWLIGGRPRISSIVRSMPDVV